MASPAASKRLVFSVLFVVLALFVGLGAWLVGGTTKAAPEALAPPPRESEVGPEGSTLSEPTTISTSRVGADVPTQVAQKAKGSAAPSARLAGPTVQGRVLDIVGNPVAGASILAETRDYLLAPKLAVSGADGSFQFASQRDELRLIASNAKWRTLRTQVWRSDRPRSGFIVVAPCIALNGVVVNQEGVGLSKARITVETSSKILAQFPFKLDDAGVPQQWSQDVDHQGQFALDGAISSPGTRLKVECDEYVSRTLPMPSDASARLRVELERDPNLVKRMIRGIVVRRSGEPATEAVVRFGNEHAATDAQGAFELPCIVKIQQQPFGWDEWSDDSPLIATEAGSQAAILPEFGRVVKANPRDPPPQKLFLGAPPLSIRGRVLDGRRQPLAGYTVTLVDPTLASFGGLSPTSVEQLTSGADQVAKTDAQGEFELSGLFERRYRLQIFSNKTLARLESGDIPAGARDVELVFPTDAFVPEIVGRVVGRDGVGIGGAKIVLVVVSSRTVSPNGGGGGSSGRDKATTAADGSFRAENVPRHGSEFRVSGTDLIERSVTLKDLDLEHPIVIRVDRARRFRIEGLPATENKLTGIGELAWTRDKLHLLALDAQQNELRVSRSPNSYYGSTNRLELGEDPSEIYTVSEAAFEFVLYATNGTILGRRPARLVSGSVSTLVW